ncbi:MAG: BatA domain-containing protein [Pirellulales bacterium]
MIAFPPGALPLAIAGVSAAAAPILIHLFNRARYREVDWGAMEFLLEAAKRSRSLLRFRDLWLLVLRAAAVVLFGLAVARPFLQLGAGGALAGGPVHAIVVIDNSMSMMRARLGGTTLLNDAKDRARDCLANLPAGSRVTVMPLCGPAGSYSLDPLRSQDDAGEAVDAIRCADRAGTVTQALELASQAAERAPDLAAKRIVFIGDQQVAAWPADAKALLAAGSGEPSRPPLDLQAVAVAVPEIDNTWVESFALADGVADVELPATLTAVIRHEGSEPRRRVQVSLTVDAAEVATETIDLEPGQAREVTFSHLFDAVVEPGKPAFVAATVSLPGDAVPEDDRRGLVLPVVAALPVVFVDQYGAGGEDLRRGRLGETRSLRQLLAPVTSRDVLPKQLVKVRHVTIDTLDEETLAGASLAVVAGIRSPGRTVPLLRSFVEQGGQLVIAAGGDFDPAEWTSAAWLDGSGILPAPLGGTAGRLPDEAGRLEPRRLAWNSMRDEPLFRVPDVPADELADLYGGPLFFKTAVTDMTGAGLEAAQDPALRPRVLAAFDDGTPFLVTRRIGRGSVAWLATGLTGSWNTLAKTNAMLLCDRLLRGMLADTLPAYTIPSAARFTLPVAAGDRRATLRLERPADNGGPGGLVESLTVEALGGDAYGVTLRDLDRRGIYVVTAMADQGDADTTAAGRPAGVVLWRRPVAVNGPARESEPAVFDARSFAARHADVEGLRWVGPDARVELSGARVLGHDAWWWLLLGCMGCLVGESCLLARPREPAAP